jgi:hypothetical protein
VTTFGCLESVLTILIICIESVSFFTVCEFDNTDMEDIHSIEWRHVSGVRTHRSVKWCLSPLNNHF